MKLKLLDQNIKRDQSFITKPQRVMVKILFKKPFAFLLNSVHLSAPRLYIKKKEKKKSHALNANFYTRVSMSAWLPLFAERPKLFDFKHCHVLRD